MGRALTPDTLGAWLVKARPDHALAEHARAGFADLTGRCVRPSYRLDLVRPGQPVLLWISGRDAHHPPGVHAAGETTGPVEDGPDGPLLPVRLVAVAPPVPREALLEDPGLRSVEVLRMPAGSNPSYLDRDQYAALVAAFPQVDRGARPRRATP